MTISEQQTPMDENLPVATPEAIAQTQVNALSVQAASLVRSIDALSNIFWLCYIGFFLSVFFAGLAQLDQVQGRRPAVLGVVAADVNSTHRALLSRYRKRSAQEAPLRTPLRSLDHRMRPRRHRVHRWTRWRGGSARS